MSNQELKSTIFQLIDRIEDTRLLEAVYTLLAKQSSSLPDNWENLTKKEKDSLNRALYQAEKGEGRPHQEVMEELREKYGK